MDRLRLLARRHKVTIRLAEAPAGAALAAQPGGRWLLTLSAHLAEPERLAAAATLIHTIPLGAGRYQALAFERPGDGWALRQRLARQRKDLEPATWAALDSLITDAMLRAWAAAGLDLDEAAAAVGLPAVDVLERYRRARMVRAEKMHRGKTSIEMWMLLGEIVRAKDVPRPAPKREPPSIEPPVSGWDEAPPPPDPDADRWAAYLAQAQALRYGRGYEHDPAVLARWPFTPRGGWSPPAIRCPLHEALAARRERLASLTRGHGRRSG